jgi:CRISPR-associated protein (Cas_Csd1)
MLNELFQAAKAIEKLDAVTSSRHPRINPMGKNRDLLVVGVAGDGAPRRLEFLKGETAAKLFRVEHGSSGSSFPGFNLPTPLRCLSEGPTEKLQPAIEKLLAAAKNKINGNAALAQKINELFELSAPRTFTSNQKKQFQRSCSELVEQLLATFSNAETDLKNFQSLLTITCAAKLTLGDFTDSLAQLLAKPGSENDRGMLLLYQDILFGILDWKKRSAAIGTSDYWKEKKKRDNNANQPVYFDLDEADSNFKRVAHGETSRLINEALLRSSGAAVDAGVLGIDAYSGQRTELQDKFPSPQVAELGNLKLFSVNTNEVRALRRYGLEGEKSFPVSAGLAQKMSDALLYLASEDKRGVSCRAIPSSKAGNRDLLVAYIEGDLEFREQVAEMFGGEVETFSDLDFAAIAQPVIQMLEGKLTGNPNLDVCLLSFSSIDKGRKQIGLNRRFRVKNVIRAAKDWQAGARNTPEVSVWFYDKSTKKPVFRALTVPCPLEVASTVNRVWTFDANAGFTAGFQRAVSVADAYDIFIGNPPLTRNKVEVVLGLLVRRMSLLLASLGAVKITRDWKGLSDTVRWQCVKAIALLGILLHKLEQNKETYMHEPTTQVGRLLALADSLHLQYCRHVRKGESPSQLIGNALFNTALDQPVFALARLAERLTPYQAWGRTFQSNDPKAGVGLVKYFLNEIAACAAAIRLKQLPERMSDADKAKLLLGYLADHAKTETSTNSYPNPE